MTDPEFSHWHPVASLEQAGVQLAEQPLGVTLLGQPLVLWRDGGGTLRVWADRCPHRGAQLSLGRVCEGRLECPYHGWQFEGAGHCVRVPALPQFTPPATFRASGFDVQEHSGMVWVRLADGALPPPAFAAEADVQLRKLTCGPYEVATSAPRIVENFLDMAHFAFVHEGWLGMRSLPGGDQLSGAAIEDYRVEPTPAGLIATGCRAWQPRSSVQATGAAQVEYRYEVNGPYSAVLTKVPDAASVAVANYRESIALFICPLTPESSRVWFRLAVADFASSDDALRQFQHTIFMQDQPVLESQQPRRLPLGAGAELQVASDRASVAYRRYLSGLGVRWGTC
jgi:phenylpropionate dioxygenase-like ring-hydroxylating dioxygenase large terminal subunit